MISKVIFDTGNPFKFPKSELGWDFLTYTHTHTHNLIWKPPLAWCASQPGQVSGSKAYRDDQLSKTSVESHLVKFVWVYGFKTIKFEFSLKS